LEHKEKTAPGLYSPGKARFHGPYPTLEDLEKGTSNPRKAAPLPSAHSSSSSLGVVGWFVERGWLRALLSLSLSLSLSLASLLLSFTASVL